MKILKQCDKKTKTNNYNNLQKLPSVLEKKSQEMSINEQDDGHSILPSNNDELVPARQGSCGDLIPPHKKQVDNQAPFKNGVVRNPPSKDQVDSQKTPREPYREVCAFEETESVTLFTSNNYKVATSIGLITSRMRLIKCVFNTADGPKLYRENLVVPD